jgi:hypothetical protein
VGRPIACTRRYPHPSRPATRASRRKADDDRRGGPTHKRINLLPEAMRDIASVPLPAAGQPPATIETQQRRLRRNVCSDRGARVEGRGLPGAGITGVLGGLGGSLFQRLAVAGNRRARLFRGHDRDSLSRQGNRRRSNRPAPPATYAASESSASRPSRARSPLAATTTRRNSTTAASTCP